MVANGSWHLLFQPTGETTMCGIVHRPTRRKDLDPSTFPKLSVSAVSKIVAACEDVHIPHLATALVLHFANHMAGKKCFTLEVIPFALYEGDKRIISRESVESEAAVIHLAMASTVRRTINAELAEVGLVFELGHCCDIQMWELTREEEAATMSHDWNIWRADKLRMLTKDAEEIVSSEEFISIAGNFNRDLISTMISLASEQLTHVDH